MRDRRGASTIVLSISLMFCVLSIHLCPPLAVAADSEVPSANSMDLSGKWHAIYDSGGWGIFRDVVNIVQNGDSFVGTYAGGIEHLDTVGKGEEKIKGEIAGNTIVEVLMNDAAPITRVLAWEPCEVVVSKGGKHLVIKRTLVHKGATIIRTLTLDRDPL